MSWHVVDGNGRALAATGVTLQANKGYGGSNATFTINGAPVSNTTGSADALRVSGTTDSSGNASFIVTDTTQGTVEAANTPTNAIDPLDRNGTTGGTFGQFALQIGSVAEANQTMDVVEVHILQATNLQSQTISFPALTDFPLGGSDQTFAATTSAGSAYQITFTASPSQICSIVNGNLHALMAGSCTVTATQPGDSIYSSAYPVSRTVNITPINYDVTHGQLLWSQDFSDPAGTLPASNVWTPLLGDGYAQLGFSNYGTGEIESNSASEAQTDGNGNLVMTATKSNGVWTSSRIWTQGKVNFQYGFLEARIQFPTGNFNWPAFWMLGSNYLFPNHNAGSVPWPSSGEIDIAEGLGDNSVDQSTLHGNNPDGSDWNGGGGLTGVAPLQNISSAFHTFGLVWAPNSIAFTLDGTIFITDSFDQNTGIVTQTWAGGSSTFDTHHAWPFNQPFFILLDNAIQGKWASLPDGTTSSMKVDWIKYYANNGLGTVTAP